MSTAKSAPVEVDPKIAALLLAGVVSEIRDGKVNVICVEKIDFRGDTTLIVKFRPAQMAK